MSIATAVLVWGDPDDPIDPIDPDDPDGQPLTEAELNAPFKIDVLPSQPSRIELTRLLIYAHDALLWHTSNYESPGGTMEPVSYVTYPGLDKTEIVELSSSSDIIVDYPVGSVFRIVCLNGLFDADALSFKVPRGTILSPSLYSVINGKIVFNDEAKYYGILHIRYTTTRYKIQRVAYLSAGTHYLHCSVPNTSRQQIITIHIDYSDDIAVVPQTITIRDYCTDEVIPHARVDVAGQTFTADANGNIVLNGIASGQTLPVVITARGYHDSDADTLSNDTITT